MCIFDKAVVILDEIDLILHPLRSELNWPLDKRLPLDFTAEKNASGMRWELPLHMLDPILFAGYGTCTMSIPRSKRSESLLLRIRRTVDKGCEMRAMTRQPHLQLLERRFYEVELRPLLARWMILFILKLGVKLLDEAEMIVWIEHGQPPKENKASALERDAWQVRHFPEFRACIGVQPGSAEMHHVYSPLSSCRQSPVSLPRTLLTLWAYEEVAANHGVVSQH